MSNCFKFMFVMGWVVIKQFDTSMHLLASNWKYKCCRNFSFYTGNLPWCVLVPIKFQAILTIISFKIQFLRWVVVLTFGTQYSIGCRNLCSLWSDLQENTTKVLHEGGPNSMKAGLHKEWS